MPLPECLVSEPTDGSIGHPAPPDPCLQPIRAVSTAPVPHFLIIDDNPGDLELVRIAFEISGTLAVMDTCHDGVEAMQYLELATQTGCLPGLVLLDLNMPRANGFEVLAFLRNRDLLDRIPVVVWSTSIQAEDRRRSLALGARAMYSKPDNITALRQLVAELVRYLDPAGDAPPRS